MFLCEFMCTMCMQVPKDVKGSSIPWNWSQRQLRGESRELNPGPWYEQ